MRGKYARTINITIINNLAYSQNMFDRQKDKQKVIQDMIDYNKTLARTKANPDFNIAHPAWTADAQTGKYTALEIKTKQDIEKIQKLYDDRI